MRHQPPPLPRHPYRATLLIAANSVGRATSAFPVVTLRVALAVIAWRWRYGPQSSRPWTIRTHRRVEGVFTEDTNGHQGGHWIREKRTLKAALTAHYHCRALADLSWGESR